LVSAKPRLRLLRIHGAKTIGSPGTAGAPHGATKEISRYAWTRLVESVHPMALATSIVIPLTPHLSDLIDV